MKHKEATCKLQDHLLAAGSIKLVLLCSQFCVWHLRPALALKAVMRCVCCALVSTPAQLVTWLTSSKLNRVITGDIQLRNAVLLYSGE